MTIINTRYITGYAGTGKSTKLIQHVKSLKAEETMVLAPTHKALARLGKSLPTMVGKKTIHSLLGWIPGINENAEHVKAVDITIKSEKNSFVSMRNFIIDEAGMMSQEMLDTIVAKISNHANQLYSEVNIYFYLDPYQLLPVQGKQIAVDNSKCENLVTQYRSSSLDVVAMFTGYVKAIKKGVTDPVIDIEYSDNVMKFDIEQFQEGDKIIAFTNNAVDYWNNVIARRFDIKTYVGQHIQLGNLLETMKIESMKTYENVAEITNDFVEGNLILQNSVINLKFLSNAMSDMLRNPLIKYVLMSDGCVYPAVKNNLYKIAVKAAKAKAVENRKLFSNVYALGRAYPLSLSYASTAHKVQGSEFDRVFIDFKDISQAIRYGGVSSFHRMMYVATSRAKKTIYI